MNGIDSPRFSYFLPCAFAALPIKEAGLPLEFGTGHVIHFSQWNGNMRDITEESKITCMGCLGGSFVYESDFGSGHDQAGGISDVPLSADGTSVTTADQNRNTPSFSPSVSS